ncbi:MAG: hypothetical protein LBT00_02565 [Spirochaetaceae bacterium]|jgi:hypothetical protein|nr:hypothetical protein [Spirochaetaceae bacterium]
MVLRQEIDAMENLTMNSLDGWYKSSERTKHPHPKKIKVECSLDEDVIQWLEEKTDDDEKYSIYINYYLRKMMEKGLEKNYDRT